MKTTFQNKKTVRKITVLFVLLLSLNSYSQILIFEDFEDSTVGYIVRSETQSAATNTASNAVEFNLNRSQSGVSINADYFSRAMLSELNNSDPAIAITNIQGSRFFGAQDTDDSNNPNGTSFDQPSLNWFNIDVSSVSTINISAFFAENQGGGEFWDPDHSVRFEYSTNNSTWTPVFAIESSSNSINNQAPRVDTNLDGLGDGAEITNTLTEYTSTNIDVSSLNTISVRILFVNLTLGQENIALDNFTIKSATPVDSTPPSVSSISVNGSPTTNATSVNYDVVFSESVTGVDTSDFTIDGSGVTGNITNISGSGSSYLVTVGSVSGTGTLSIDLNSSGTNIIDAASNGISGGFTAGGVHTVDTVAPTLTASTPSDNTTGVLINQNIELTFSENVSKGSGSITFRRSSDNSIFETINIAGALVSVSSNVVTINPANDFELNTMYYLQIDNTAFLDAANNNYLGFSDNASLNFTSETNQINNFVPFNGNWSDTSSWSLGRIPISTDNITVDTGKTLTVNVANATVNNLTINISGSLNLLSGNALTVNGDLSQNGTFNILTDSTNNASLIVNGSSTGNINYLRYLTTNWHLVSSPVENQNINAFQNEVSISGNKFAIAPYLNNTTSLLRWNYYTDNTGANDIASAGTFNTAKGYTIQKKTVAGTLLFNGSLHSGSKSIAITDGGDNPSGNRWNLVGNPYTAAINGNNAADATNNFLKVNIDAGNLDPTRAGVYLWNGSTPYIIKSLDDPAFYIASGQAFFVHAPDAATNKSANFTPAMQTHQTGNIFLKNAKSYPEIILNLSNGKTKRFTKIRYIQDKTTGLDVGSDVGTFTGVSTDFNIYSHLVDNNQGVNFAIQALPNHNLQEMVIPIGINAIAGTEISFHINTSNFPEELNVYLEDRVLGTTKLLKDSNNTYTITLKDTQNGTGRFYLHTTTSVLNTTFEQLETVRIYKTNNTTLTINGLTDTNTELSLFNILGKQVFKTTFNARITSNIMLPNIAKGIYVVQLKTSNGTLNKKIILE